MVIKVIEVGTNPKPVCDFLAPLGVRDNVRCSSWAHWKVCSGLPISVNWTFFARCYGWVATSEEIENRRFRSNAVSLIRNFRYKGSPPTNNFCTASYANECLTTLPLTVFTQRNFVADFLQAKCNFRRKSAVLSFLSPPLGGGDLRATLTGKHVVNFLLVFRCRQYRDRRRSGPIVTPALILAFLLLTQGYKIIIISLPSDAKTLCTCESFTVLKIKPEFFDSLSLFRVSTNPA